VAGNRLVSDHDNGVDTRDPHTGALLSHVAIQGSQYGLYDVDADAARGRVFVQTQDSAGDGVFSFVDVARGALARRLSYVDGNPLVVQYVPSADRIFMTTETFDAPRLLIRANMVRMSQVFASCLVGLRRSLVRTKH